VDILDTVLDMVKDDSTGHWSKDTTRPWSKEAKEKPWNTSTIETPWGRRKGPSEDSRESSQCDPLPKKQGVPTLGIQAKLVKKSATHGGETLGATDPGPASRDFKILQSNDKPIIGKGRVTTEITADTRENQSGEVTKSVVEILRTIEQEQVLVAIDTYWTDQQSPMVSIVGKGRGRATTHIESHTDQPCGDLKLDTLCLYVATLQFLEHKETGTYDRSQDTKAKANKLRGKTISLIKDKL
jgi:hypothetical protein